MTIRSATVIGVILLIAGCGNKGDLYLPVTASTVEPFEVEPAQVEPAQVKPVEAGPIEVEPTLSNEE